MAPSGEEIERARAVAAGRGSAPLLLHLWQRVRIDWSYASDELARAFRANRRLGSDERRFVAETLYGMIRHLRRIDEALACGGSGARAAAPDRERLLAYLILEGGLPPADAASHAPTIDWAAVAGIDDRLGRERDPVARIARRHSLPDWLAARLHADWGDEALELAAALNQRAPMTVRANTLKTDREALMAELSAGGLDVRPGRHCDLAAVVESRTNLFSLAAFRRGWFEAQDEGSQLAAELVAPPPRALVADICAGAGGKSLALAAALGNRGRVVAVDIDERKLAQLRRRARRAGANNLQSVVEDLAANRAFPKPLARIAGTAARVLADVPCSGVGALRRNPEARWRLGEAEIGRFPALQRALAGRAVGFLAPGGRLIYATCTLLHAENREVVASLVADHSDLEIVPVKAIWGAARAKSLTDAGGNFLSLAPHRHGTDGFFAAVMRKRHR